MCNMKSICPVVVEIMDGRRTHGRTKFGHWGTKTQCRFHIVFTFNILLLKIETPKGAWEEKKLIDR